MIEWAEFRSKFYLAVLDYAKKNNIKVVPNGFVEAGDKVIPFGHFFVEFEKGYCFPIFTFKGVLNYMHKRYEELNGKEPNYTAEAEMMLKERAEKARRHVFELLSFSDRRKVVLPTDRELEAFFKELS